MRGETLLSITEQVWSKHSKSCVLFHRRTTHPVVHVHAIVFVLPFLLRWARHLVESKSLITRRRGDLTHDHLGVPLSLQIVGLQVSSCVALDNADEHLRASCTGRSVWAPRKGKKSCFLSVLMDTRNFAVVLMCSLHHRLPLTFSSDVCRQRARHDAELRWRQSDTVKFRSGWAIPLEITRMTSTSSANSDT